MVIPGYDPDDLEQTLLDLLEAHGDDLLSADKRRRVEQGESILDVLDSHEIEQLLRAGGQHSSESASG